MVNFFPYMNKLPVSLVEGIIVFWFILKSELKFSSQKKLLDMQFFLNAHFELERV